MIPDWLESATILRCPVGSRAYGISDSNDQDIMGICLEPFPLAFGLRSNFEQHVHRTAADREQDKKAPSQAGDVDMTIYSLRKWARLALDGNPSTLELLFAPYDKANPYGHRLRELTPAFLSKRAGARFLGYMHQQKQRLLGEKGQRGVNRQDLVDAHGYDTKYMSHIIRLGFMGIEYLNYGMLSFPMQLEALDVCKAIRRGEMDQNDALSLAGRLELELKDAITSSPLPDEPDEAKVNKFVLDSYAAWWNGTYWQQGWKERL